MRFIDEVEIIIISGHGGAGASSTRREKFVPRGGVDGGNGGRGGHILFEADNGLNTLVNFRGKKTYQAMDGKSGGGSMMDGHAGEDLIIKVPVGTMLIDSETGHILYDLNEHGKTTIVAQGGKGGLGNAHFKSSTNQTPTYSQDGLPGLELKLKLELKLIADVALIGLPNAGKSTLISAISAATPKVADYPFTTLEPNLGVVTLGENSLVVADIPGLIENAHQGKGLGIKFLKHIERTKALIHLVDPSMCLEEFEAFEMYTTIREELAQYDDKITQRLELICLTKTDAMSEEEIEKFKSYFEKELDRKVLVISSVSGKGLDKLKAILFKMLESTENLQG
ncbi:MAG: GTPase ObgE [Bacteriovoracaceae bacterium]|nr:GTPase ObgE [Bacteriovoracaceae bacterium]